LNLEKQMEGNPELTATRDAEVKGESASLAFARRVFVATCVVASVAFLLYFVWYASDLLMLVFAGVLVSILLRGFSRILAQKTGLGPGLSLALISLALVALIAAGVWLIPGRIGPQMSELREKLPLAVENVKQYAKQYEWARATIESLPNLKDYLAGRSGAIVSRLTGLASTTLGLVINFLIAVVIGLYLASQPGLYSNGIKHLFPFWYRERAGEILGTIDEALWRWIGGRFTQMLIIGVLTTVGLRLLGVPLALLFGLLAGLLNFIPYFGPWIAAIPAVLIAFLQGPQQALNVALFYLVLQSIDGYVLTPLVDRRSVELPPALTITALLLLGLAFGFIGILLASPLAATVMILVKMVYVEDVLGDRMMHDGREAEKERSNGERTRAVGSA
jgi:predicted PurR-regulated permease PerM